MREHHLLSFEPFRLDVSNAQLWQGQEVIRLTNKALAVLCYVVEPEKRRKSSVGGGYRSKQRR